MSADRDQDFAPRGPTDEIERGSALTPLFDAQGLIPAIVTDAASGGVLMFAYMNREALTLTLSSGYGHFWSRSRNKLWQKGEGSGNRLKVLEVRTDCDQDVIWLRVEVEGNGVACHTGEWSCFYRRVAADGQSRNLEKAGVAKIHVHGPGCSHDNGR